MYSDHDIKQIAHDTITLLEQYGTDSRSLSQRIPAVMGMLKFMGRTGYAAVLFGFALSTGNVESLATSLLQLSQGTQDAVSGFTTEGRTLLAELRTDQVDWRAIIARMEELTGEPVPYLDASDKTALLDYLRRHFPS